MRCMECVAPIDEVGEALKFACLQQTISGSGKEGDDVGRGER